MATKTKPQPPKEYPLKMVDVEYTAHDPIIPITILLIYCIILFIVFRGVL